MRNFTNSPDFDDTLPVADGLAGSESSPYAGALCRGSRRLLNQRGKGEGQPVVWK